MLLVKLQFRQRFEIYVPLLQRLIGYHLTIKYVNNSIARRRQKSEMTDIAQKNVQCME